VTAEWKLNRTTENVCLVMCNRQEKFCVAFVMQLRQKLLSLASVR